MNSSHRDMLGIRYLFLQQAYQQNQLKPRHIFHKYSFRMSNHLIGIRKMHGILHPPLRTADKQDDFTIFDKIVDLFAIFTFNHYYSSLYVCFFRVEIWNEDNRWYLILLIIFFVNSKISMKYSLLFYKDHFHLFSRETNLMVKKIMIYTPIPNFLPVSHN